MNSKCDREPAEEGKYRGNTVCSHLREPVNNLVKPCKKKKKVNGSMDYYYFTILE